MRYRLPDGEYQLCAFAPAPAPIGRPRRFPLACGSRSACARRWRIAWSAWLQDVIPDRVAQVSDAIRCREDIRAVQFQRLRGRDAW